jgi:hypothetical protein
MASTIKVDNVQNQPGSNLINRCSATTTIGSGAGNTVVVCGSTVTIGRCGGTVALASGATQTGFGRTGTVDWQTGSIKTTGFTAESGKGYFCNTDGGAFTATLPASPSAGDIVGLADYTGNFATANLTVGRNSSKIEGATQDGTMETKRESKTFVYVDGTQGWCPINDNTDSAIAPKYITATGGTISTTGNCKIHKFTGPGTFCVSCAGNPLGSNKVSYFVVAGGAGGGGSKPGFWAGGGGGAGGFREGKDSFVTYTQSPAACTSGANAGLAVPAAAYPITIGAGGSAGTGNPSFGSRTPGGAGVNSVFSSITSAGGGGGSRAGGPGNQTISGVAGGSGGGTGGYANPTAGGAGNTPPVSPPQGNNGGTGTPCTAAGGGGGGGIGGVGGNGAPGYGGGCAGAGLATSISGSPVTYASGGEAGGPSGAASAGPANSGIGGAGGFDGSPMCGAAGGSGIVIIRYRYQ